MLRFVQIFILIVGLSFLSEAQIRCFTYDGSGNRTLRDLSCDVACTLVVSNANDSGQGSLRYAVGCAQNGQEVTFASLMQSMQMPITSGAILVNKSITISQSAINPNILTNGYPVFDVTATGVIFRNLHIVVACNANAEALTIKNQGSLTLDNVTLSSNNTGACSHNMVKLIGQLTITGAGQTKIINP